MTRIVALVPAYDPEPGLVDLVTALAAQVAEVVVVDDGSASSGSDAVWTGCRTAGAIVVHHKTNRGIAAALNTGIEMARANAAEAVVTVDQDSAVSAGFVDALLERWMRLRHQGFRVGVVAPEVVEGLPRQREGRPPIQSGLLIPMTTVDRVGAFDVGLFIDGVDDDFALRCLDAGLLVVVVDGLRLGHRLGERDTIQVLGRRIELTHAEAFRYYYLTRNQIWLLRRHARRHPSWAIAATLGLIRHFVLIQVCAPGRTARSRSARSGLLDGLNGSHHISARGGYGIRQQ
jgi:rhamnosyltransferase